MKIETDRLLIRTLLVDDAGPISLMWSDPDVTQYSGGPRDAKKTFDLVVNESAKTPPRIDRWTVLDKTSNKFLGECGFIEKEVDGRPEVELIYYFKKESWGKGFATEAGRAVLTYGREQLKLNRIVALLDPLNLPSKNVAEKLGFKHEKDVDRGEKKMHLFVFE